MPSRTMLRRLCQHAAHAISFRSMHWMLACAALAGIALPAISVAGAAEPQPISREVREFEVLVKGTPRGTTNIKIEQYPDRRTVVTTDALVQMNLVVYTYTFEFHGSETWVADRLERFSSSGSDGGKKYAVSGVVRPGQTQGQVNNKPANGPEIALTSSYWRLPMLRVFNENTPIIDASTGAYQKVRINRGGEDQVNVNGVAIPCTEFRFSGDVDARIWLDRDGLIVRQESVESGYPTEMRLKRVTRENPAAAVAPTPGAVPVPVQAQAPAQTPTRRR